MENTEYDEEQLSLIELLTATSRSLSSPFHNQPIDLTSPAATSYLFRLTSLPLSTLQSEPSRIADESAYVEGELTNLCFREQKTFIDVHRCADDVQGAFDEFGQSLDRLVGAVPPLEKECESFAKSTRGIQQDRKMATLVLEHQDKLLDLLEIPQLLDTCVRNGYYQEAMELSAHSASLAERYGDIPIVLSVQQEVLNVMQLQLSQLLTLLREPVKLPTLVKAVTFLRRMGDIPEPELRVAFLESREYNFRTQLGQLERDRHDRVRYTRKYIDLFRENVYDTISQYSSIFLDPTILKTASPAEKESATSILILFCHHSLSNLLTIIDQNIPLITDTSSLSSLLTQLGYCSLSFARVGMDFSAQIAGPFENAVLKLIKKGFEESSSVLRQSFKDAGRLSRIPSTWLCTAESLPTILSSPTSPPWFPPASALLNIPPQYLSSYPPLAIYTNSTLSTLNSLRLLAPLSLLRPLLVSLETSLSGIITDFLAYARIILHETSSTLTRPTHNRRNTSVGNQGIATEVRAEREKEATRVLCAFAGALLAGVERYLRRALVEGVYDAGKEGMERLGTEKGLVEAVEELEGWVGLHGVKREEVEVKEGIEEQLETKSEEVVPNGKEEEEGEELPVRKETFEISDQDLQEQIADLETPSTIQPHPSPDSITPALERPLDATSSRPSIDAVPEPPAVEPIPPADPPFIQLPVLNIAAAEILHGEPALITEVASLPLIPESANGAPIIIEQAPIDPIVEPSVRKVSDSAPPELAPAMVVLEAIALHGKEAAQDAGAEEGEPLGEPVTVEPVVDATAGEKALRGLGILEDGSADKVMEASVETEAPVPEVPQATKAQLISEVEATPVVDDTEDVSAAPSEAPTPNPDEEDEEAGKADDGTPAVPGAGKSGGKKKKKKGKK